MSDAAARASACDPSRSFIVQAPAGSGKTTLLTQRVLALLATVPHPEALLAITFTRKAAAEMRARVVEALLRAAAGDAPQHAADALTLQLARAALAHDAREEWNLLAHPARLRIQTIDALNHWLASRLPVLSRAGASLAIEPRPQPLYALAARRTLAEIDAGGALAADLATLLTHLDNESERCVALLAQMLPVRDRWLRLVLGAASGARGAALRGELEAALAALADESLARLAARLPAARVAELLPLARAAAARLAPIDPAMGALAQGSGTALAPAAAALPQWQALAALTLTAKGTWRRTLTVSEGFPPEARSEKPAFLALIARLGAEPGLEAALAEVARLPPTRYADDQWQVLAALHGVLLAAAARLAEVFAERGRVDYVAVARAALQALGAAEEPSELALELDYRVQHVLVDEFQDTSAAQLQLLERLTAGWQRGDGRTLFLVGDPMQSIYGFREGNVGLFLGLKQRGLGDVHLEPLQLTANFRSTPAIIEWVNATFAPVFPAAEDLARGAVCYAATRAERPALAGPGVGWQVLADGSREDEGRAIAALVAAELAARPTTARIAVLGRARAQLAAVAAALAAARIRFQGVDLVPLADRPVVRDLVALTRALLHPADRIAWLAVLRAPWCGAELSALWALAGTDSAMTVWQALADETRLAALPASVRVRLERTRTVLGAALAERGRRPLAALVEAAWVALGGPATAPGAGDLEDARTLLARLDALERAGDLEDPAALESQLAALYAAPDPEADGRVQLLTIHAAKGLEWEVVILAGLGRSGRGAEAPLLRWLEFARAAGGSALLLAPQRARAVDGDALESYLAALERDRDRLEQSRLLYVAATRAKDRLHLVTHVEREADGGLKAPRKGTPLATLWPSVETAVRAAGAGAPAAAARGAVRAAPLLLRLADDWSVPAATSVLAPLADPPAPPRPSEFEFEWVSAAARHVGTAVHEELERAARVGLEALAAALPERARLWRRRLTELGVAAAALPACVARIERALVATAADSRGRWLFDPAHREARSEFAVASAAGPRLTAARVDRTFVDAAGVRWIVDFKTSEHEGRELEAFLDQEQQRYAPQLEDYAALLGRLDPGRPLRLGLYFPLHRGWREWAAGERR